MNRFRVFKTAAGHLIAVGIGLLITFVGLSIMLGGLGAAAGLVAMSVICTAGIGLAFWAGIAWILGWFTLLVVVFPFFASDEEQGNSDTEDRRDGAQTALIGYIQRSRAANATESQITNRLISQGWSETDIEQAYRAARGQS